MPRLKFNAVLRVVIGGLSLIIVTVLALVLGQRFKTQEFVLGAQSSTGDSYILGNALNREVERHNARIRIKVLEPGGTAEKLQMIENGRAQLAAAQADTTAQRPLSSRAQEWSVAVFGISIFANLLLALILFELKKQQDTHSGQAQIYLNILSRMESVRPYGTALRTFIAPRIKNGTNTVASWEKEDLFSETLEIDCPTFFDPRVEPRVLKEPLHWVIDRVAREFDILAFMDRKHLISPDLVDEFYAPTLADFIPVIRAYLFKLRQAGDRDETHFWELEQLMDRIEPVRDKHPGITKGTSWPRNPRTRASGIRQLH